MTNLHSRYDYEQSPYTGWTKEHWEEKLVSWTNESINYDYLQALYTQESY